MVGLDGAELAHQLVVLGVGDLGVVEAVVAVVVVGDEAAKLLGPGDRVGPAVTGDTSPDRRSPPAVGSRGDSRADHHVGVVRVVEGHGLARGDPPLGGGEGDRQPVAATGCRVLGTGRPWALHWATAGSAGPGRRRHRRPVGRPSTQVTVWRNDPVGWAASGGPSDTRRAGRPPR